MGVRIGNVTFNSLQKISSAENRELVEQMIPGFGGNQFQDLGREPVTLYLEGLILGQDALSNLEELRQAQINAEPLPFSGDIAVGSELVDVLVQDLQAEEQAGYENRFWFKLVVREYVAPPEPVGLSLSQVSTGILGNAQSWLSNSFSVLSILDNPLRLVDLLSSNADILQQLNMSEFAGSLIDNIANISGGDFSSILKSIAEIDPIKVVDLINDIRDAGGLGAFIKKIADEGLSALKDILPDIPGLDIILNADEILDFLKRMNNVRKSASELAEVVTKFDINKMLEPLRG